MTVFGADNYSMRIWLDPELMRIRSLTPADVYSAIQAQNMEVSAGSVGQPPTDTDEAFQFTLVSKGRLSTPEEFRTDHHQVVARRGISEVARHRYHRFGKCDLQYDIDY